MLPQAVPDVVGTVKFDCFVSYKTMLNSWLQIKLFSYAIEPSVGRKSGRVPSSSFIPSKILFLVYIFYYVDRFVSF